MFKLGLGPLVLGFGVFGFGVWCLGLTINRFKSIKIILTLSVVIKTKVQLGGEDQDYRQQLHGGSGYYSGNRKWRQASRNKDKRPQQTLNRFHISF